MFAGWQKEIAEFMIYRLKDTEKTAALWKDWQETLIWSCMQGVMGEIYVNHLGNPNSAMAVLGDFCFLAGKPDREFVLSEAARGKQGFMIMVPRDDRWAPLIEECLGGKAKKVTRYAVKKEPDVFDREKLKEYTEGLPNGYELKMIDEALFWQCRETAWCRDFVSQYVDYALYRKYGLGAVICKDGEIVSGASSYSGYRGGIEIEIDTREDYRRKGLACACGAKLILECLERGLYPSWDAQNKDSLALAEKLGYHFDCAYRAYEVVGENECYNEGDC